MCTPAGRGLAGLVHRCEHAPTPPPLAPACTGSVCPKRPPSLLCSSLQPRRYDTIGPPPLPALSTRCGSHSMQGHAQSRRTTAWPGFMTCPLLPPARLAAAMASHTARPALLPGFQSAYVPLMLGHGSEILATLPPHLQMLASLRSSRCQHRRAPSLLTVRSATQPLPAACSKLLSVAAGMSGHGLQSCCSIAPLPNLFGAAAARVACPLACGQDDVPPPPPPHVPKSTLARADGVGINPSQTAGVGWQ